MDLFYENAFWGFLALVGALIVVISKLFNKDIENTVKLQGIEIKKELESKYESRIKFIEDEIKQLKK